MLKKKYDRVKKIVILSLISSIVAQSMPINVLAMEDKIKNVDLEEKSENKFLDKDKEDSDVISSTDKDKEDSDVISSTDKDKEDSEVTSSTGKDKEDKEDSEVTSSTDKDKEDSEVTSSTGKDKDDKKDINSVSLGNISIEVDPELGKDFRYGEAIDINIKFTAVGDRYGNIPQNTIVRLNISSSAIDYSKIQVSPQNHAIELIKHPDKNYVEVKFNQDFKFDRSLNLSIMTSIKSHKGTYSISSELVDKDGNITNLPLKDGVADETLNVVPADFGVTGWLDPFWDGENYIGRGTLNNGDIGGIFNPKTNEIKIKATLTAKKDVDNINTIITLDSGQSVDKKSISVIDIKTNNEITDRLSITATDNLIEFNTGRIVKNTQYLIKFTAIVDSFDKVYTTDFKSIASNGEIGGFPIKSGFRMNTGGAVPTLKANNLITYKNIPIDLLEDVVATDIEDGNITNKIVVNDSLLDLSKEGTYKVTYIVQDSDYNSVMKTVDVIVLSNDEPIIRGASNKTIKINEVDSFNKLDGVIAEDNQDGIITDRITISGEIGKPSPGSNKTYKLTYSVTDNHKNTTRVVREITVTNQFPTISGLNEVEIRKGKNFDLKNGITAHDEEDGNITKNIVLPKTDITKLDLGKHSIEYTITDSDGNTTKETRVVNVSTNEPPTINGANDVTIKLGEVDRFGLLDGVMVTDDHDKGLIPIVKGIVGKPVAGSNKTYIIVYTVTDSDGNTTIAKRKVTVTNQFPTISGLSDISIRKGYTTNLQAGVLANDTEDGNITASIVYPKTDLTGLSVGNHDIKYTVTDSDGNTTIAKRKVMVRKDSPELNGSPNINGANDLSIKKGSAFDKKAGVTATDKEDGDITKNIQISGTVDVNTSGEYELIYSVTDSFGNTTTVKRVISVLEDITVVPPTDPNIPVVPPTDPDMPVVPPTDPDMPVVPPTDPDIPVVPPTDPDIPVVPPTDPDMPVVPPKAPSKVNKPFKITIDDITNENLNPKTGDDSLLIYIGSSVICLILFSIINRKKLNKK
ncbi:immunoglobulin-like domain-containing protein [Faecalimicrobium sp. JNUCC 81]